MTQTIIPQNPSFEEAIAFTQQQLEQIEQDKNTDLGTWVTPLVTTPNGARGFFVTYLTDPRPAMDELLPTVANALATSPDTVAELLIKNLAMSTAMEITHQRNDAPEQAAQSAQVQRRTAVLIRHLDIDALTQEAQALRQSLQGEGSYSTFLQRWGYDTAQKQAIAASLTAAFPHLKA
jgi:hypothetical protein